MTADEKTKFLETMRQRRDVGETAESHNKAKAVKTLNFVYPTGDEGQWDEELFNERDRRGLPCLTINRLRAFGNQVTGDQLQNRPQIKVRPAGLLSDQKAATHREGIIRQTEQVSRAKFIIDQTYKTMVFSGFPAHWQINTRFIAEDSMEQEIIWEPIEDQFSVVRDPYARENDRRDANWIIILETISEDEWKRRYGDKPIPSDAEGSGISTQYNKWFESGKTVTLAIYWTRKSKKRVLCVMPNGSVAWEDELSDSAKRYVVRKRETDDWTTEVSTCSGNEILEEPKEKPWRWIPVVSMIPPYILKQGKRWYQSLYEDAMDPQRYYNYWKSLNAQQVKPKPIIVTGAQIKGLEAWWDRKDKGDLEYLLVNPTEGGMPQWPTPPTVSSAIVQEEQSAIDDIKSTMGMWNPSLGVSEQSLSGKAIGKLQMAGDKGNMDLVNSLVQALTFTGDIILDMVPYVLDTPREVPVLGFDMKPGTLKINQKNPDGSVVNDMKVGKFRAVVDVGPSFTTQRQEALDSMGVMVQGNPQIAAVLAPFMAKFADWPYAEKIFEILKALQPPNIQALYDDQEEQDPKILQLKATMDAQMREVMAQLEQAGATVQQLQEAVAESQAVVAAKEEELKRAQAEFELAKREIQLNANEELAAIREEQLTGKEAKVAALAKEIAGLKMTVDSMDKALADDIKQRPEAIPMAMPDGGREVGKGNGKMMAKEAAGLLAELSANEEQVAGAVAQVSGAVEKMTDALRLLAAPRVAKKMPDGSFKSEIVGGDNGRNVQ